MTSSPASHVLEADLEPRKSSALRTAWRWIVALVSAAFGADDIVTFVDLVVRRKDTGAEVLRTPADVGDPERLLATVREDLATKTVTEFAAEWRLETGA